ncbi:hypothetical protein RB195_005395 [Necator americanus]|uniref:Uncharacterized protein n=1 Tax=Necator americanus TaxID=51031 RepID=A0ABR1BPF6_NECAM
MVPPRRENSSLHSIALSNDNPLIIAMGAAYARPAEMDGRTLGRPPPPPPHQRSHIHRHMHDNRCITHTHHDEGMITGGY